MDENTKDIIRLGLMAVAIIALIIAIFLLVKYKEVIISDPLSYGMDKHSFSSCQCYDSDGRLWESSDQGFYTRNPSGNNPYNYSITKFNITIPK